MNRGRRLGALAQRADYADVPVRSPGVRLPSIPSTNMVYDAGTPPAPPAAIPPTLGIGVDYEASSKIIPLNGCENEVGVYSTHRRWRGCDVYVDLPPSLVALAAGTRNFVVSIFVYASSQTGGRSLVSSGRLQFNNTAAFDQIAMPRSAWVCAARGAAERFDVTVMVSSTTFVLQQLYVDDMVVTVVAADELSDPPEDIGSFIGTDGGTGIVFFNTVAGTRAPPLLEVIGVTGVSNNAAGAARFLLLFDTSGAQAADMTNPAMQPPLFVWPLGSGVGSGFSSFMVRYRALFTPTAGGVDPTGTGFTPRAPVLAASSTPNTYTAVADCTIRCQVR